MNRATERGLHLDEDFRQQKIEWRLQRIVWPLLVLLLVAVMAGLLGQGPIARASVGSPEAGITMEYRRFVRQTTPDQLVVRLQAGAQRVRLRIDGRYLDAVAVERVFPEPETVLSGPQAATLEFDARPGEWTVVRIELRPQEVGTVDGWIAVDEGPPHAFSQFVYP